MIFFVTDFGFITMPLVVPHTGGFNALFLDGHAAWESVTTISSYTTNLPFQDN